MTDLEACFTCNGELPCGCERCNTFTTDKEGGPACPHCGEVNEAWDSDGALYDESTTEWTCESCSTEFRVDVSISHSWSCRPKEEEDEG